jgi:hypothetical protein
VESGILWKRENFDLQAQTQTQFWLRVNLLNKTSGILFSIINVYIPNNYNEKIECWQSLIDLAKETPPQNLIIAGDFNTTRAAMEKRGGSVVRDQFRERLEDLILTWTSMTSPQAKGSLHGTIEEQGPVTSQARLDRFLINSDLLALPDKPCSMNLPWAGSDHRPIRLTFETQQNWGPIPFKLNPLWLDRLELLQSIAQAWNQWITGSPNYIWEHKLKLVKDLLKSWAKNNLHNKAQVKKSQLEALQDEMESAEIQQNLLTQEQSLHKDYLRALEEEETTWWLKSRSLWLKAGDQNTTFFHNQAKVRNWSNQISELKTQEGETLQDFDKIKQHASSHFHSLYTTSGKDEDHLSDLFLQHIPSKVTKADNYLLDRPIEEVEILRALNQFQDDKAPGPDGFTLHFYKKC